MAAVEGQSDHIAEPNGPEPLMQRFQQLSMSSGSDVEARQSPPPPPSSPDSSLRKRNISPGTPAAARLARISTPLEGNSPSTSQVSTGSIPPSMVANLLADLTPVTRNTSGTAAGAGAGHQYYGLHKAARISPEDSLLLGEDLILPSHEEWYPKIRPHGGGLGGGITAAMKARSQEEDPSLQPSIPLERKFYSFTSRQQYEGTLAVDDEEMNLPPPPRLTPYQPNRELLGDLGLQEDLHDIFIARRRPHSSGASQAPPDVDASKQHRLLLHTPIPMSERQISIPSIRMANHLNGSITSREEDEDSLYLHDEEDASLSSRGSYTGACFGADDDDDDVVAVMVDAPQSSRPAAGTKTVPTDRRKRGRKEQALEWLQSVVEVSDHTLLAEAASSKFLTRHEFHPHTAHNLALGPSGDLGTSSAHVPFPRRDSSPPKFLAALPR